VIQERRLPHRPLVFASCVLVLGVLIAGCSEASTYPRPSVTLPPATTTTDDATATTSTDGGEESLDTEILVATIDDLAGLVSDAAPGSVFRLAPGVHRSSEVVPKDGMTFVGLPGAVMSGARIIDGFERDGDRWHVDGVEFAADTGGECIEDYASCGKPNDLFIDGVMLWRADTEAEVEPGAWWGDDGRIVLADDPSGRLVELSVGSAREVTIRDLVIQMYATPSQEGAVQAQAPDDGERGFGWLLEDVEIRNNHAAGLRTGNATVVRRVHAHHNGQLGIAVSGGDQVAILESELAYNNIRGYFWEWEGGGGKFTRTDGLIVRGTHSHDNLGPGLWTDIDCVDTTYDGNTVVDNLGPGIFHEISGSAVIRDNDIIGNGYGKSSWAWGAGVLIAASFDVEVVGNQVVGNADAITAVQQERGTGPLGERRLDRIYVHDNAIDLSDGVAGVFEDVGDASLFGERDIRFESNRYSGVGNRQAYGWSGRYLTAAAWQGIGQDEGSTWE
jgi:parallel beta-helix repeat protein